MAQEVEVKPEGPTWLKEETRTYKLLHCGEYSTPLLWHGPLMENTQVRGRIKRQWGEVSVPPTEALPGAAEAEQCSLPQSSFV